MNEIVKIESKILGVDLDIIKVRLIINVVLRLESQMHIGAGEENIEFTPDYKEMSKNFTALGYNSAQIRALVDSALFIRIFGKHHIPLRVILLLVSLFIIEGLILHIFYTGIFSGL